MFLILGKELSRNPCMCTLIGVLYPHTVRWENSITHLRPVATFLSACALQMKWRKRLIRFSLLKLWQFDTSERCSHVLCARRAAVLPTFLELAAGRPSWPPHLGPPGLLPAWDRLTQCWHVPDFRATHLASTVACSVHPGMMSSVWPQVEERWTLCRGDAPRTWLCCGSLGPQAAAWQQGCGTNTPKNGSDFSDAENLLWSAVGRFS